MTHCKLRYAVPLKQKTKIGYPINSLPEYVVWLKGNINISKSQIFKNSYINVSYDMSLYSKHFYIEN